MRKSRAGVGLQMALALLMPPKGKAVADSNPQTDNIPDDGHASPAAPPYLTGRWDFSRLFSAAVEPELVGEAKESAEKVQHLAHDAWRMTVKAAKQANRVQHQQNKQLKNQAAATFRPKPMTHEEIRLWLQSFNAGPYALLKYEGDVPYEETQNYVPRVLKYYEQDLSSDYDKIIDAEATKYGLDPQMIKAIMKTESDFRNDCVSHAGARGLLQIMPVVWKDIKERYDLSWDYNTQVFEPKKNIEVGCAYLAWLRYDFLPRHFAAYDRNPDAPVVLIRDHDLGVPDRETPRIIAKGDTTTPREEAYDLAYVDADVRQSDDQAAAKVTRSEKVSNENQVVTDAGATDDKKPSVAEGKSEKPGRRKIEISDAGSNKSVRKTQTRRSSGKAISISVDKNGIVKTRTRADSGKVDSEQAKATRKNDKAIADATPREDRNGQGG